MNEADFWSSLEYRVSREMEDLEDCRHLGLWCDGFSPHHFLLGQARRSIQGSVWIGLGPRDQKLWTFELFTPTSFREVGEIEWQDLLPPDEVTEWLVVFPDEERLELWPAKAIEI